MSSSETFPTRSVSSARLSLWIAGLLCATSLAGCSADLGRFDLANSSVTADGPRQRTALLPSEPMRRSNAGGPVDAEPAPPPATPYNYNPGPYQPPQSNAPVRLAGLPEPVSREPEPRRTSEPARRPEPARRDTIPVARATPSASIADPSPAPVGGTMIEVQQGDTVYGLAKKHRVSISELMSANNLQTPMIKPGQKLALPAGRRQTPARRNEKVAAAPVAGPSPLLPASIPSRTSAPSAPSPAPVASEPPAGWTGTHTVTPRDNLYGLAKRYNVKVAELQSVNGITDPSKMRAGTVLKVPGSAVADAAPAPAAAETQAVTMPRPRIINARDQAEPAAQPERVAVAAPSSPVINDASPEPPLKQKAHAGIGKFRWPAKGKVVANFGPRADNTHNDGINILVPQGTSVVAAESGTVAYAGSELKGYGNLVLIRHEGNWVSAYAHNDALLVKRGDKVERGQSIAKAGKTGAVDQPQVHFELRQGSKPVDPMPHLEK